MCTHPHLYIHKYRYSPQGERITWATVFSDPCRVGSHTPSLEEQGGLTIKHRLAGCVAGLLSDARHVPVVVLVILLHCGLYILLFTKSFFWCCFNVDHVLHFVFGKRHWLDWKKKCMLSFVLKIQAVTRV